MSITVTPDRTEQVGITRKEHCHVPPTVLQELVRPGHRRHRHRHPPGPLLSGNRRRAQTPGRRLRQADQDGHRTHHLLHRGQRHRRHAGHEGSGQDRRLRAGLLRNRLHRGPDHRPGGGQHRAAGRRHARRPVHPGHQGHRRLCRCRRATEHHRLPAQRDPQHHCRRLRQRRHPAGTVLLGDLRLRPAAHG
ncbi:hypothetical protein D9M70_432100 [compost metagenome]